MKTFETPGGATLAYHFEAGASPLVLIHGAHLSHRAWAPQKGWLETRPHLLLDLRGHGGSSLGGQPYSVTQFAADVLALLEHLDITDATLCGHSLGGMVAQVVAARAPEQVGRLVLAETSYGIRSARLDALLTGIVFPLLDFVPITAQARLFARQLGAINAEAGRYLEAEVSAHAQHPLCYRAVTKAVIGFEGRANLGRIGCPTLIMVGARNKRTHSQAKHMHACLKRSKLVLIDNAGHMLNWDNPASFNAELRRFIEPSTQRGSE